MSRLHDEFGFLVGLGKKRGEKKRGGKKSQSEIYKFIFHKILRKMESNFYFLYSILHQNNNW